MPWFKGSAMGSMPVKTLGRRGATQQCEGRDCQYQMCYIYSLSPLTPLSALPKGYAFTYRDAKSRAK